MVVHLLFEYTEFACSVSQIERSSGVNIALITTTSSRHYWSQARINITSLMKTKKMHIRTWRLDVGREAHRKPIYHWARQSRDMALVQRDYQGSLCCALLVFFTGLLGQEMHWEWWGQRRGTLLQTHSHVRNSIFNVLGNGFGVAAWRDLGTLSNASGLTPFPERMNSPSQAALYAPIDDPYLSSVCGLALLRSSFLDASGIRARQPAAAGLTD
jgi:hypothetical protein